MTNLRSKRERLTTTIKRQWLAEIIAGTKKIEYREIKPYWTEILKSVKTPFELRLLNGMNPPRAGSHRPDRQGDEESSGRDIRTAHKEDTWVQALG
jgi:hypothetical protein